MEPASGDSSENLNDIIIKKELNIEFDEYQNILTDGLQIDSKQEVWEDLKEDVSNCEALKRPTNRKNIKRENESQPAYPETSKKQKLLHQSSEDETVVIKNEPEIEFQNNTTETGQVIPSDGFSPFNVDYSLVPIGDQHIPCISWSSQSYCLLKALKSIFVNELSEDIVNCAYIHPFSVSDLQNKFLVHIDLKFSDATFTTEDEFISIEESHLFYNFLKTCISKLINNTKNSNKCGLIKMMDETVIPYVVRYNSKLLPLCYFKNRRDLQLDLNKLKIETVSGWELSYLKFCCIVRGTASGELFESDACDVASLTDIVECFPLSIKFEDYWPRSDSEFELLTPSQDISLNNPQFHYLMEGTSTSMNIPKNMNGKNNAQSKSTKEQQKAPTEERPSVFTKDEMLIELVKSKRGLYDLQSQHYSDNNYKKRAWNEIEEAVGLRGAKNRWEGLRSQYRKYLIKLKTKSGQGATKIFKWRYYDQMQFINEFINCDKPRISTIIHEERDNEKNIRGMDIEETDGRTTVSKEIDANEEVELEIDPVNTFTSNVPPASKKQSKLKNTGVQQESASATLMKYILDKKEQERTIHPIDNFFALIADTVKQFSAVDQHFVKTQVFTLVSEIEEKYVTSGS